MNFYPFEITANVLQTITYIVILVVGTKKFLARPSLSMGLFIVATACVAVGDIYWISLLYIGNDSARSFSASDISEIGNVLLLYSITKTRLDRLKIRRLISPGTILAAASGLAVFVLWTIWSVPLISTVLEVFTMTILCCTAVLDIETDREIPRRSITTITLIFAAAAALQFVIMNTSGTVYTVCDAVSSILLAVLVLLLMLASFRAPQHRFSICIIAFIAANYAQSMCVGIFYSLSMILITISYALLFLRIEDLECDGCSRTGLDRFEQIQSGLAVSDIPSDSGSVSLRYTGRIRYLFIAFLSGMCACLFSAYINSYVMYYSGMSFIECVRCTTPIIEEVMCMLPPVFFLLIADPDTNEILYFGALLGAGFAGFENFCYIAENGIGSIEFVLMRIASAGVLHIVCGLILGISFSIARRNKTLMLPEIGGMLTFNVALHSIYNLYVSSDSTAMYLGLCIPLLCLLLAFLYRKRIYVLLSKLTDIQH